MSPPSPGRLEALAACSALTALLAVACASSQAPHAPPPQRPAPSIHPELAAHTRHFEKRIYPVGDRVHVAVGWQLANTILVEGEEGLVIVDVGSNVEPSREILSEFRKITKKPVRAIVYTHFHPDHTNGVRAFADEADLASGRVRIFAHETLMENVTRQGGTIGPILGVRTIYSFGLTLPPEDLAGMNDGIGPKVQVGPGLTASFLPPTDTFADELEVSVAGVRMHLLHVPSESPDEVAVWLPDEGVLLSGESIQGPTLPNLHTLRGTRYRDLVTWHQSLDELRSLNAQALVPSHGQPVFGEEKVEEVLRTTRDAIQYVHDQSIRRMNQGQTPDELARTLQFPPHLANYAPYAREYYGTIEHSARQVYQAYLGWFEGDPLDLDPLPRKQASARYVTLMGGHAAVLANARHAYASGDDRWAAELAGHLIAIQPEDAEARLLKAYAYRRLGYASMNTNWRNWYLVAATELEGTLDPEVPMRAGRAVFASPDFVRALPACVTTENMRVRLAAERVLDLHETLIFEFPDSGEVCALEIRRGVAQFHPGAPPFPARRLRLPKRYLDQVLMGRVRLVDGLTDGELQVSDGDVAAVARFFDYFEDPFSHPVRLSIH